MVEGMVEGRRSCWDLNHSPKVAQSVPEQDAGSRSAQMQLFLGDLNHFHIAKLEAGENLNKMLG